MPLMNAKTDLKMDKKTINIILEMFDPQRLLLSLVKANNL